MEDYQIVDLYWQRSERAIEESDRKYGRMLTSISLRLVPTQEDAEECLNDTYLAAWSRMPDERPVYLGAYLSRIIRALSIDKYRKIHSAKRGGCLVTVDELDECIPSNSSVEKEYDNSRLAEALNSFLLDLEEEKRYVFVRRYYYSDSIDDIARLTHSGKARIKSILHRVRGELRKFLEREGIEL